VGEVSNSGDRAERAVRAVRVERAVRAVRVERAVKPEKPERAVKGGEGRGTRPDIENLHETM